MTRDTVPGQRFAKASPQSLTDVLDPLPHYPLPGDPVSPRSLHEKGGDKQ